MHTRISRFADQILEATVLVAVLAIPLLFNPYSARVFEAEKVSLLRAVALIAVTAWLVRFLEVRADDGRLSFAALREQPVILAALLLGLVTHIAGFTSITPHLSLWGSYQRGQGIITTLGYLVVFFATVAALRQPFDPSTGSGHSGAQDRAQDTAFRRPDRRRRLVTTMLVASGPIALLAVVQYAGLNPVPLRILDPSRVFGTLSNPIFLGAYLVMVIPLTLAQITRYRFAAEDVRWSGLIAYVVLLVLQLAAALFSGSRGPLIGIGAGVFLFVFLLALQGRRRGLAAGLLSIVVLGLALLVVLNLPSAPLASLQSVPVVGRFEQVLDSGSGRVRVLIWQGVVERFAGEPARLALGYGPESTHAALLSTYQPELRHLEPERLPDRAHNVFLEALVTTGLVGAAGVVLLFAALFYTGLRGLGLISTPQSRNRWLALTAAGLALGLLVPRAAAGDWTFAGVGVGLGLMAGLGAYLVLCLWRPEPGERALTDRSVLVAAVLAALAGHLLEITVGIRVTATESLFWVLAGLLTTLQIADCGLRDEKPETRNPKPETRNPKSEIRNPKSQIPNPKSEIRNPKSEIPNPKSEIRNPKSEIPSDGIALVWDSERAGLGLLGGLMLSTLALGVFLLGGADASASSLGRWVLLIGAWLLAGPLWLSPPGAEARPGTGWVYPLVSLGWAGLFLAIRGVVELLGGDALTLLNLYFAWLLLSLAGIAASLPRRVDRSETGHSREGSSRVWTALAYSALGALALGLVAWLAVKPLHADIYLEAADAHAAAGQWPQALAFYQQAAREAPDVDVYQQHLGEARVTAARLAQDPDQREGLFQAGQQAFQRAVAANPAEGTHLFNLAHLYLLWGQAADDPDRQAALLDQAADLYEQAASRIPNDPRIFTEWGLVLQERGDVDAALAKYRVALEVDPRDAQAYLQMGSLYQRSGKAEQALQMYQQAIELEPNRAEAYRALADLYRQAGRLMDAVTAQQRAAELRPTDYVIHQNLALLYRDLGQIQNAVAEARLALSYAPPEQRGALQSFIQSLLASSAP